MKNSERITIGISALLIMGVIIPFLTALLAVKLPITGMFWTAKNKSYEGTPQSYFHESHYGEEAEKDFSDIAYYFDDKNLFEYFESVFKTIYDPSFSKQVLEDELHIDQNSLIESQNSPKN